MEQINSKQSHSFLKLQNQKKASGLKAKDSFWAQCPDFSLGRKCGYTTDKRIFLISLLLCIKYICIGFIGT